MLKVWIKRILASLVVFWIVEPLLQLTPLRHLPPLKLILAFELWLGIIPLSVLLAASSMRLWRLSVLASVGLGVWLWLYGNHFIAHPASTEPQTLRVMTWNLLFNEHEVATIADKIKVEHPDVLAVQELSTTIDQPLAQLLIDELPYQARFADFAHNGLAVYSKYPITSLPPQLDMEQCRCQQVSMTIANQPITLINTHPHTAKQSMILGVPYGIDTSTQDATFEAIEHLLQTQQQPLILLGDFNTTERQPNYVMIRRYLNDTYAATNSGFGFTYPNEAKLPLLPAFPMLRLDYVFTSMAWQPLRSWSRCIENVSDHCYVVADLRLQTSNQSR